MAGEVGSFRYLFPPYLDRIAPCFSVHDLPRFIQLILVFKTVTIKTRTKYNARANGDCDEAPCEWSSASSPLASDDVQPVRFFRIHALQDRWIGSSIVCQPFPTRGDRAKFSSHSVQFLQENNPCPLWLVAQHHV